LKIHLAERNQEKPTYLYLCCLRRAALMLQRGFGAIRVSA